MTGFNDASADSCIDKDEIPTEQTTMKTKMTLFEPAYDSWKRFILISYN